MNWEEAEVDEDEGSVDIEDRGNRRSEYESRRPEDWGEISRVSSLLVLGMERGTMEKEEELLDFSLLEPRWRF